MKVSLWTIGKTKSSEFSAIINTYNKRLQHYLKYEYREILLNSNSSPEQVIKMESDKVIAMLHPQDELILWDVNGKVVSSEKFAGIMQDKLMTGRNIVFLIGGAYGFHSDLYNRAGREFSLSKMTFNHQMVRVIVLEQLYRAMTILNNEPYHNG